MKPSTTVLEICLFMTIVTCAALANNIAITNLSIKNVNATTADIEFDLSWSNSFRWMESVIGNSITNYDAAWVFVKYRVGPLGNWQHALLSSSGHTASPGSVIEIHSNGSGTNAGAMVYRSDTGTGGIECENMILRWDMAKNGLARTNYVDISVHAIEMVKIPECNYGLGSGGSESSHFYKYPDQLQYYLVTNAGVINVGQNTGDLYYSGAGDSLGPIPAAYPNGFSYFYCMKYEITQGQYADFLNHLPGGHALARFPNAYGSFRNTIKDTVGVYSADTPDRACNYLMWNDVSAYLDWAALRPMTELEYEKVCRGPAPPYPNEYAWGDTYIRHIDSYEGIDGSGSETAFPTNANCHYFYERFGNGALFGPTRVGIFARTGTTRREAGAGYYGVMELTGNVEEQVVGIGNSAGRGFQAVHGDGFVQTAPPTWPTTTGTGQRGGTYCDHYYTIIDYRLRTSDRAVANSPSPSRSFQVGGRGVRSAQ